MDSFVTDIARLVDTSAILGYCFVSCSLHVVASIIFYGSSYLTIVHLLRCHY